jgi:hypothetical protein
VHAEHWLADYAVLEQALMTYENKSLCEADVISEEVLNVLRTNRIIVARAHNAIWRRALVIAMARAHRDIDSRYAQLNSFPLPSAPPVSAVHAALTTSRVGKYNPLPFSLLGIDQMQLEIGAFMGIHPAPIHSREVNEQLLDVRQFRRSMMYLVHVHGTRYKPEPAAPAGTTQTVSARPIVKK